MRYEDCLKEGLLRKTKPDLRKALRSLEVARQRLKEARESLKSGVFTGSLVLAYSAMFHAARALLFKDGWVEKSHACVVAYLRAKYVKTGKLEQKYLSMLDAGRIERHETLYGLETTVAREDAAYLLDRANEFLTKITEIVKT